jgi:hypothetical protein
MTDTTTERPPPTSLAVLREHWLPSEPADTDVARWRAAVACLDQMVTAAAAELAARDEHDRAAVARFVDEVVAGDVSTIPFELADRPQIEHRLARLRDARAVAAHRLERVTRSDPVFVAWRTTCDELVAEWRQQVDAAEDKLTAVAAFAARHGSPDAMGGTVVRETSPARDR